MTDKIESKQPVTEVKVEVKPPVVKVIIPDFDEYLNVALSPNNYTVVKEAVSKYPEKLIKIMQYVNSVPQDQLKEVFSRSVF